MQTFKTPRSAFWGGVRHTMPILFGVVPFGLVYGVAAAEIGLTTLQGLGMSILLFAGAAQFVTVELLQTEAAAWIVIGSIAIVNLRFVVYSASLASHFAGLPPRWKALGSYFITDEPYALSISYFTAHPDAPHKHCYHLGHGSMLWLTWVVCSAFGLLLGTVIPDSWSLEFANSLMFISLLVPAIKGRPLLVAGLAAGIIGLFAASLPHNTGFVLAVVCGISTGLWAEHLNERGAVPL